MALELVSNPLGEICKSVEFFLAVGAYDLFDFNFNFNFNLLHGLVFLE